MTLPILLLLIILAIALVLFWFEWIPPDVTALGVLLALIVLGLIPLDQAFSGFGSDTVMLLLGLLIMTAALMRTGVVEVVSRNLLEFTSKRPGALLPATMLAVALLSSVINNTAAAAFFLPVILGISQRSNMNASRLLMPMAFAAILASSVTLVSTSTNVVVSVLMTQFGLPPIGMLELTPVGVPVLAAGLLYMWFFGQRLIPERPAQKTWTDTFGLGPNFASWKSQRIALVGRTLASPDWAGVEPTGLDNRKGKRLTLGITVGRGNGREGLGSPEKENRTNTGTQFVPLETPTVRVLPPNGAPSEGDPQVRNTVRKNTRVIGTNSQPFWCPHN